MAGPGPPGPRQPPLDDLQRSLIEFCEDQCRGALEHALEAADPIKPYGIPVSVEALHAHDEAASRTLFAEPEAMTERLQHALMEAQRRLFDAETKDGTNSKACFDWRVKQHLRVRLRDLPRSYDCHRETVSAVRSQDKGRLVCVHGTLMRVGEPLTVEWRRGFRCEKKECNYRFELQADLDVNNEFIMPEVCPSHATTNCTSNKFKHDTAGHVQYQDVQEVRLMDEAQKLGMGNVPRSMPALLLDDLIDCAKPGDDVAVVGTVRLRWPSSRPKAGRREPVSLYILASSIVRRAAQGPGPEDAYTGDEAQRDFVRFWRRHAEEPLAARNHLVRSLCPQLCDMELEKLAVLLTLAGGVERRGEGGAVSRGSPHLLLVGDPGTGKSQLLKYAARLAARAVFTTGVGSSVAGLTAAVARDERGRAHLEAGALVLADGGLCCIDEFASIRPDAEKALLEAMEQQTISLAKAGMTRSLPARTSILAAMNPRGTGWDPSKSVAGNLRLSGPLVSRFDVILLLRDARDPELDARRAAFSLAQAPAPAPPGPRPPSSSSAGGQNAAGDSRVAGRAAGAQAAAAALGPPLPGEELWDAPRLRAYLQVPLREAGVPAGGARGDPACEQAERLLQWYWRRVRENEAVVPGDEARTTPRLLESLLRLAEGPPRPPRPAGACGDGAEAGRAGRGQRTRGCCCGGGCWRATRRSPSPSTSSPSRGTPGGAYRELAGLCEGPDVAQRQRLRTVWGALAGGDAGPFDEAAANAAEAEGVDPAVIAFASVRGSGAPGPASFDDPPWPSRFFRCRPDSEVSFSPVQPSFQAPAPGPDGEAVRAPPAKRVKAEDGAGAGAASAPAPPVAPWGLPAPSSRPRSARRAIGLPFRPAEPPFPSAGLRRPGPRPPALRGPRQPLRRPSAACPRPRAHPVRRPARLGAPVPLESLRASPSLPRTPACLGRAACRPAKSPRRSSRLLGSAGPPPGPFRPRPLGGAGPAEPAGPRPPSAAPTAAPNPLAASGGGPASASPPSAPAPAGPSGGPVSVSWPRPAFRAPSIDTSHASPRAFPAAVASPATCAGPGPAAQPPPGALRSAGICSSSAAAPDGAPPAVVKKERSAPPSPSPSPSLVARGELEAGNPPPPFSASRPASGPHGQEPGEDPWESFDLDAPAPGPAAAASQPPPGRGAGYRQDPFAAFRSMARAGAGVSASRLDPDPNPGS
eukprot:tig00021357_g20775.t1